MILNLAFDDFTLDVAPHAGGGVTAFRKGGLDVLRPASAAAVEELNPLGLSCFPLTPWMNRIAHGRFHFQGCDVQLHQPGVKHPVHGQGWRRPWAVKEVRQAAAAIEYEGGGDEWPWRYRSRQTFRLDRAGLTVDLDIENLDSRPMPASTGLHPYFPDIGSAELQARTEGMWETDDELIPTRHVSPPTSPSFNEFRPLAGTDLDNCFTGFGGQATIRWKGSNVAVRLSSPQSRFMQVYTRGNDGSFCVEAQTAMPDPFNHLDAGVETGLAVVQPGERLTCRTHFEVV